MRGAGRQPPQPRRRSQTQQRPLRRSPHPNGSRRSHPRLRPTTPSRRAHQPRDPTVPQAIPRATRAGPPPGHLTRHRRVKTPVPSGLSGHSLRQLETGDHLTDVEQIAADAPDPFSATLGDGNPSIHRANRWQILSRTTGLVRDERGGSSAPSRSTGWYGSSDQAARDLLRSPPWHAEDTDDCVRRLSSDEREEMESWPIWHLRNPVVGLAPEAHHP